MISGSDVAGRPRPLRRAIPRACADISDNGCRKCTKEAMRTSALLELTIDADCEGGRAHHRSGVFPRGTWSDLDTDAAMDSPSLVAPTLKGAKPFCSTTVALAATELDEAAGEGSIVGRSISPGADIPTGVAWVRKARAALRARQKTSRWRWCAQRAVPLLAASSFCLCCPHPSATYPLRTVGLCAARNGS